MAAIRPKHTAAAAVTVTLTSLGSGAAYQSAALDFTGAGAAVRDVLLRVKTNGQAGGTGTLDVYVAGALSDTVYADGATGSNSAFIAANRKNAKYLDSIQLNAAASVVALLRALSFAFGGSIPQKFALIFINASGAALSATGTDHVIEYEAIYDEAV
jgi:hypothetical protein